MQMVFERGILQVPGVDYVDSTCYLGVCFKYKLKPNEMISIKASGTGILYHYQILKEVSPHFAVDKDHVKLIKTEYDWFRIAVAGTMLASACWILLEICKA